MAKGKSLTLVFVIGGLALMLAPINVPIVSSKPEPTVQLVFSIEIAIIMSALGLAIGRMGAGDPDVIAGIRLAWIPLHFFCLLVVMLGAVWFGPPRWQFESRMWLLWSALASVIVYQAAITVAAGRK